MTRLTTHQLPAARLRAALDLSGLELLPDADLLDRFARYAEHAAFDVLLRRHGPMVYGVCRRVLANTPDTDDAFQATFLVLVRKAGSLRRADRLGPWLYGVAFKVASKARSRSMRLATRQTEATDMIPDPTPEPPDWLPILDAELSALPAKYREPLVLCELQGATRADAAKTLGIPEGTLSSRLARGRNLLRKRLLKHGTLLPAGGLAALFTTAGIGRAAIPASLFTKTSELASLVATGTATAGMVPAGAARLTDEVMKSMMLTKLRLTLGAALAVGLIAVGLVAALPADAPAQANGTKAKDAKSPATAANRQEQLQTVEFVAWATIVADRDALQGLWVLDKYDLGKTARGDEDRIAKEMAGKMQFLMTGDVLWGLMPSQADSVMPARVKLDSAKNPKWIDITDRADGGNSRCIYELDGDKLRICLANGGEARPAEFNTDGDSPLIVMHFRREKLPPAAGEKALVGSWAGEPSAIQEEITGPWKHSPAPRVEIYDGYLFAFHTEVGGGPRWLGGKYTVDTTKNPKWIDVELTGTVPDEKVKKLYGCYELADGQLKLALGSKRATRPLELKPATDVIFFDVKPTKEPLIPAEKAIREESPKHDTQDSLRSPPIRQLPDGSTAPAPRPVKDNGDQEVEQLMKAGKFPEAEALLGNRVSRLTGLDAAEARLLLGICILGHSREEEPLKATKRRQEAAAAFQEALRLVINHEKGGGSDKRAARIGAQAEVRLVQLAHLEGKPDLLLTAAEQLRPKHSGTIEELVLLSFVYHAYQQKGELDKAQSTRERMRWLFDKLKDKPDAFTAESGERSRGYWEEVWFAKK